MHSLFLGMTECGKSCLAKSIVDQLVKAGKKVVVYDPMRSKDWSTQPEKVQLFDDMELFVEYLTKETNVFGFVDESGEAFDEGHERAYFWLATRSRHLGHSITFIAQRLVQIPRTMRDQCGQICLFTSSAKDGKEHAEEWNKKELESCNTLKQFEFFRCGRYTPLQRLKIVDFKKVVSGHDRSKHSSSVSRYNRNGSNRRKMDSEKGA